MKLLNEAVEVVPFVPGLNEVLDPVLILGIFSKCLMVVCSALSLLSCEEFVAARSVDDERLCRELGGAGRAAVEM
jgi:hypothetical protein